MPDYAGWVARALAFMRSVEGREELEVQSARVAPPISVADTDALARAIGRPLPGALRAFLTTGAGGLDCRYVFHPDPEGEPGRELDALFGGETTVYGGASIIDAAELPDQLQACASWASGTWVRDDAAERALWEGSLPVTAMLNGDYLALDVRRPADDPPVLYLAHDDESRTLAPSFTAFLDGWERVCYVGPELWMLEGFLDAAGHLNPDPATAERLRRVLGV